MGVVLDGDWRGDGDFPHDATGRFVRPDSPFRSWVTADGAPGPTGAGGFHAAAGRYHLIVSLACPWAHRTLIFRKLKGLESMIVALGRPLADGRARLDFRRRAPASSPTRCSASRRSASSTSRRGPTSPAASPCRCCGTRSRTTIVNNEVVRNHPHVQFRLRRPRRRGGRLLSGGSAARRSTRSTRRIYETVNNGVYRAGFATTQEAYEEAFLALFETLDWLEARLAGQRFLAGDRLTEADWRLFTTLIRFDPVYFGHFKCNLRPITDYPSAEPLPAANCTTGRAWPRRSISSTSSIIIT